MTTEPPRTEPLTQQEISRIACSFPPEWSDWKVACAGIEEGIRRERLRCIVICNQNPELTGYDLARRIRG